MNDHTEVQQLIADYYANTQRTNRIVIAMLSAILLICVYFLAVQFQNASKSQDIIKNLVTQIKANQDKGNESILNHEDCIVLFLAQPNRANISIEDLKGCKISNLE